MLEVETIPEDAEGPWLCRICLQKEGSIPIFDTKDSPDPEVYSKLCQCIGEKIEDIDGYPRHICKLCNITLNTAIKFIKLFKESTEVLAKWQQQVVKQEIVDLEFQDTAGCDDDDTYLIHFKNHKVEPGNDNKIKTRSKTGKLPSNKSNNKVNKRNKQKSKLKIPHIITKGKMKTETEKKENLKRKAEKKEKKSEETGEESSNTLCDLCGKTIKLNYLRSHMITQHSNKGTFKCLICCKSYHGKHYLFRHNQRVHATDKEKKYICSTCGKQYMLSSDLNTHIKTTHGKKKEPTPCHLCDRKFSCKKAVLNHIRSIHTGERPEVCRICEKRFSDPDYLKEHMRLHTGEKPFECLVCGKGFAQRCNLKSHFKHNHRVSQLDEETLHKLTKCRTNYLKHMQP